MGAGAADGGHGGPRRFFREGVAELIAYVRHEAFLAGADEGSKFPRRIHLEQAARQGNKAAIADLDGPPFPDALRYLYRWARDLYGRSGEGLGGFLPLSYSTIADWARLTGTDPEPQEVDALITLDWVLRHPEERASDA